MDEAYKVFRSNLSEVMDLHKLVEIIPGRLYFATYTTHRHHLDTKNLHFFSYDRRVESINKPKNIDMKYIYEPLNVRYLVEYIHLMNDKMYNRQYESKVIVHYTINSYKKYNNAALLIGTYAVKLYILYKCFKIV